MSADKLAEALAAGHMWRAKEILSGRISSRAFDAHLYEQLGEVLLRMGDDLEAGRFLFLSGARKPAYAPAIALFLSRHAGQGKMARALPRSARRCRWSDLPPQTRADLQAAGIRGLWDTDLLSSAARGEARHASTGCVGPAMLLLLLIAIGFVIAVLIARFGSGT